jgi:DNA invertase Pin-like site-specific DNA recombinase
MSKKAVGLIRVSRPKDGFRSPEEQCERIEDLGERQDWRLVEVLDENEGNGGKVRDASGAKSLAERPKLRQAVEAIEAGRVDVLAVAYADRLTWTQSVREEVLNRIEAVGGEVWSADFGRLSNGTAVEEFTGTSLVAARRVVLRQAAERARAAQADAVAAGIWMSPGVPVGYALGSDRRLAPDLRLAPVVREAFELRAGGARLDDVRAFLAERGIERTRAGVAQLLRNRAYLGELHFGDAERGLHNVDAHLGIVDRATFERVQRVTVTKGRQAKSNELLARLGVLRCASCDARMSVTTSNYRYRAYRCGNPDCPTQPAISAPLVEGVVVDAVKEALADVEGRWSALQNVNAAAEELDRAQAEYEALIELLDPLEPAAAERLATAKAKRDGAREHLDQLGGLSASVTITAAANWDELGFDARRELIRATVERVTVARGRGPERVAVELVGE